MLTFIGWYTICFVIALVLLALVLRLQLLSYLGMGKYYPNEEDAMYLVVLCLLWPVSIMFGICALLVLLLLFLCKGLAWLWIKIARP